MATFVKQQRLLDPQLLLLNAGDDFIGTEWDRKAGLDAPAAFMNLLAPDAMTVGNHEWDKGLSALKQYLDAQDNKDVLAANIDFHGHEIRHKIKPYVVKQVKGKKVCILGLTTMYGLPGSRQMGPLKIQEPYSAGRQALKSMEGQGCHATVLLSHLGYTSDLVAASALPGLDLIIGGHSHSFLWPDPDSPPAFYISNEAESGSEHDSTWGPYPTYVHNKGRDVPVVQASWGSRYMGKLVLNFKPEAEGGKLAGIKSEVFLLGGPKSEAHVPEDEEALQEIQKWRKW
ncbi:hypothetical protein OEZ85_009352 [Tetradesmus obliquus]|uniref:Calcineurin-like phosphoesterase domain-containing protein n=1 Tax=Tetradesmus obliquus TaxID=3088 RepID=A0ABY8U8P6_TETOB|nr:hypothetical protein OEZ85_009352 [Tetradesmus obliquus]